MRRARTRRQTTTTDRPPHPESGFALLLVFLMAAVIAITLYAEIPRVAFEAQRQKEQVLVSRGEQYKRAIQMFMAANKRWPAKIEDLENFNNRRYLRKRFTDPMTGKDEWRIIHIANGILTDSVVTKPPTATDSKSADTFQWGASSIGVQPGMGDTAAGGGAQGGANLANRRRSSDGVMPGMGDGSQPVDPNNPQQVPGVLGMTGMTGITGMPGMPGMTGVPGFPPQAGTGAQQYPPGVVIPPGVPGMPGQYPGQGQSVTQFPGQGMQYNGNGLQAVPGQQPFMPGMPVNSQMGGVSPYPTVPGSNGTPPGFPQPGNAINAQGPNQAQMMIQQILTTPRPGGAPNGVAGNAMQMGGGIAGFASNGDAESIRVYNDRTNYKEWEFVFDPNKVKTVANPLTGANGTPVTQMGSPMGGPIGTPVSGMPGATGPTQPRVQNPVY